MWCLLFLLLQVVYNENEKNQIRLAIESATTAIDVDSIEKQLKVRVFCQVPNVFVFCGSTVLIVSKLINDIWMFIE